MGCDIWEQQCLGLVYPKVFVVLETDSMIDVDSQRDRHTDIKTYRYKNHIYIVRRAGRQIDRQTDRHRQK